MDLWINSQEVKRFRRISSSWRNLNCGDQWGLLQIISKNLVPCTLIGQKNSLSIQELYLCWSNGQFVIPRRVFNPEKWPNVNSFRSHCQYQLDVYLVYYLLDHKGWRDPLHLDNCPFIRDTDTYCPTSSSSSSHWWVVVSNCRMFNCISPHLETFPNHLVGFIIINYSLHTNCGQPTEKIIRDRQEIDWETWLLAHFSCEFLVLHTILHRNGNHIRIWGIIIFGHLFNGHTGSYPTTEPDPEYQSLLGVPLCKQKDVIDPQNPSLNGVGRRSPVLKRTETNNNNNIRWLDEWLVFMSMLQHHPLAILSRRIARAVLMQIACSWESISLILFHNFNLSLFTCQEQEP